MKRRSIVFIALSWAFLVTGFALLVSGLPIAVKLPAAVLLWVGAFGCVDYAALLSSQELQDEAERKPVHSEAEVDGS